METTKIKETTKKAAAALSPKRNAAEPAATTRPKPAVNDLDRIRVRYGRAAGLKLK